ncbi:hypothetical protein [Streptomyces sp. NPDC006925]|uniref:hypothetical protein n=1 Tax=Streptomyces sp. NPDC006925 TaxID=3364768 RepID=UPI0036A29A04
MKPRILPLVTALTLLALAVGGVYSAVHYERWKAESVLSEACDGVLVHDQAWDLLGVGPLTRLDIDVDKGSLNGSEQSLDVRCGVARDVEYNQGKPTHEASIEVRIHGGSFPDSPVWSDGHAGKVNGGHPPVPLGRGWKGVFNTTEADYESARRAEGATSILLKCTNGRPDLLVTVEAKEEDVSYDNPETRLRHARIATATAGKASQQWGCGAQLGKPLSTVGLPVNDVESTPLKATTGTCAGLPGRRGAVTHGWESRRSNAPLESCELGDGRTHRTKEGGEELLHFTRYRLNAYYSAYAKERLAFERGSHLGTGPLPGEGPAGELSRSGYWRTASCPGDDGPALFTVVRRDPESEPSDKPSHAEAAYQRTALKAFAKRSAAHHGCTLKETKG